MKKILIAFIFFLPLMAFKDNTATLEATPVISQNTPYILFTGSGYTPGRLVHLIFYRDGSYFNRLSAGDADAGGNITSYQSLGTGSYEVESWEASKNRKDFTYKATVNFIVE